MARSSHFVGERMGARGSAVSVNHAVTLLRLSGRRRASVWRRGLAWRSLRLVVHTRAVVITTLAWRGCVLIIRLSSRVMLVMLGRVLRRVLRRVLWSVLLRLLVAIVALH